MIDSLEQYVWPWPGHSYYVTTVDEMFLNLFIWNVRCCCQLLIYER